MYNHYYFNTQSFTHLSVQETPKPQNPKTPSASFKYEWNGLIEYKFKFSKKPASKMSTITSAVKPAQAQTLNETTEPEFTETAKNGFNRVRHVMPKFRTNGKEVEGGRAKFEPNILSESVKIPRQWTASQTDGTRSRMT